MLNKTEEFHVTPFIVMQKGLSGIKQFYWEKHQILGKAS